MPKVCPHCRTEYGPEQLVCPNDGATLSDPVAPVDPLLGELLADRYRIIRTLGEGGMGRVYLAEHVRMGRLSAVKVMSPALAPTLDGISRFNREAANASRINHPNVAAIYDFGETRDGVMYLAMEYVEGETLAALSRRVGPLPLAQVGDLVSQIADGLHAAHQLGIVHRDLKPDNVLIARDADGRNRVKVVDFGIAKAVQGGGQTVTMAGMSIGTPEFMSPEQLAGEALDARTDIYSLGLVTFTMLTGELAYPNTTSKQSLVQRLTTRPRPLAEVRPHVAWPPRLQSALDRALSPEPADRYAKVSDFATDVRSVTGAVPDASQMKTRAMTPLGMPAIARQVVNNIPAASSARRLAVISVGLLAIAFIGAAAFKQLRAHPTSPRITEVARTASPAASVQSISPSTMQDSEAAAGTAPPSATAPAVVKHDLAAAKKRDSSATAAVATDAREVLGHISRARRLFKNNQPNKAAPELRTAGEELRMFAADHPGASETMMLRAQLSSTIKDALAECQQTRDASPVARAKMCDGLEKADAAFPQSIRPGSAPFRRGGRRQ